MKKKILSQQGVFYVTNFSQLPAVVGYDSLFILVQKIRRTTWKIPIYNMDLRKKNLSYNILTINFALLSTVLCNILLLIVLLRVYHSLHFSSLCYCTLLMWFRNAGCMLYMQFTYDFSVYLQLDKSQILHLITLSVINSCALCLFISPQSERSEHGGFLFLNPCLRLLSL